MESSFGHYITNQYGLLKQILSYLETGDLRNAKLVCSDWKSAVETIIDKNPTWLIGKTGAIIPVQKSLPAVIIQHPFSHYHPKKCDVCKKRCYLCPCSLSDSETLFISLDARWGRSQPEPRRQFTAPTYSFWNFPYAFMIPSSEKIQVSKFTVMTKSTIFKEPITDEIVHRCTGGDRPLKCLLVLSKTGWQSKKAVWINQFLNYIVDKQGPTFAVGGGEIRTVVCKKGFSKDKWKKPGLIFITLRGENISAHSDILVGFNKSKTEEFMKNLGKRVGRLPEGHSRVAFIAQCVDRCDEPVEGHESSVFMKYFPFVPQFGFRAYGEYGVRSCSTEEPQERIQSSKRMKMTFYHAHTTSIVILTFKKM